MPSLPTVKEKADHIFTNNNQNCGGIIGSLNLVVNELAYSVEKNSDGVLNASEISKAYLNAFVEKADVLLMWVDKDLNVLEESNSAKVWLKKFYPKQFKLNSSMKGKCLNYLYDERLAFMRNAYKKAENGKVWRKKLLKWPLTANRYRWLNIEVLPWFNAHGEISSFLMYFEDVTKHHEIELCNKKLQQSNNLLESFNLVFSHDLIQPLRQIANFSEILKLRYRDYKIKDPSIERSFDGMNRSIEHARNLSEGMALYCKQGELSATSEEICVTNLVQNVLNSSLEISRDRFNLQIDANLKVIANITTITQLFQNLFANAVKHSDENSPITLSATRAGNQVKFYLHNYGYCSKRLRRRNLFNAFESSKTNGAGIGLMICKKVVEAYSGKIFLKSWKKKGTLVTFTLPASELLSHCTHNQ